MGRFEYSFPSKIRKSGDVMIINVPKELHNQIIKTLQEPYTVNVKITGIYLKDAEIKADNKQEVLL
jgi:hypothetical protein